MLTPAETYIQNDIASARAQFAVASARYDALIADNGVRSRSGPRPWGKLQASIKTVHFSGPVTAVIWSDGTKTLVRCKDGEVPDYEKGLAMAIAKKALGTNKSGSNYYDIFKKWLPKKEANTKEVTE